MVTLYWSSPHSIRADSGLESARTPLADKLEPAPGLEPLVVDLLISAIRLDTFQQLVQPAKKIGIVLTDRPGKQFDRKRLVEKHELICVMHCRQPDVGRQNGLTLSASHILPGSLPMPLVPVQFAEILD